MLQGCTSGVIISESCCSDTKASVKLDFDQLRHEILMKEKYEKET